MKTSKESGIAIWYILVGIALFAALSYSFVRSVSQSQDNTSEEQARIIATEILQYAKTLEQALQRLTMINGCSENDISFYSSEWDTPSNYDNTNTPFASGDFNCHVFHRDGGGISWKAPKGNDESDYVFTGRLRITNVGDDNLAELMIILPNIDIGVCKAINRILDKDFSNNPPQDAANANYAGFYFNGAYLPGNQLNGEVTGHTTGCFEGDSSPSSGTYHFFHALIVR